MSSAKKDKFSFGNRINKLGKFDLFHSRFVLYFIFVVAMFNLYSFLTTHDMFSLAVFSLTGFISSFFSKNMIVILAIAIVVTNILKYGTRIRTNEGFEADKEDTTIQPSLSEAVKNSIKLKEDKLVDDKVVADKVVVDNPATDNPVTDSASHDTDGNKLIDMKAKYNELMDLQKQIVSGVQSVYEPLQKAEGIVSGMKENMRNMS